MKSSIYTTPLDDKPETSGRGDNFRLSIFSKVHSGLKPTMGRQVETVATMEQAYELAMRILYALPSSYLLDHDEKLRQLMKMVDAGKTLKQS